MEQIRKRIEKRID